MKSSLLYWPRLTAVFHLVFFLLLISHPAFSLDYATATADTHGDVTVIELTGEMNASVVGSSYNQPLRAIANEYYNTHADTYDFLVVFPGFDFEMPETDKTAGFYAPVRNDIQGIGNPSETGDILFDNSSAFGSNSRLQGLIVMGPMEDMVTDPLNPDFTDTMVTLSHEILHRWASYVTFADDQGDISRALIGRDGSHWSFLLDSDGSLMYGNEWRDNGNNTFTALPGLKYYSPLDLYLMGLIDKTEVPPMTLIENPDVDPARLPAPGETVQGAARTVTIDDIIAAEGERIPSVSDSQKRFKMGVIVIVRPGMYDNTQVVRARQVMENWVMWFSALTDGRAAVVTDAPPSQDLAENPGIADPEYDPRQAPPEIADGVSWLMENQNQDGCWQDTLLTAERDTASVLIALHPFQDAQDSRAAALDWLADVAPDNSDYIARTISAKALNNVSPDELIGVLLARQNADGGWGSDDGYGSNPLDTACALHTIEDSGAADPAVITPAIDYLKTAQDGDGAWKSEAYEDDTGTTARVLESLAGFRKDYSLEAIIQDGLAWLYGRQNADGGFGNSPSTVYDTALVVIAIHRLNGDSVVTGDALDYILNHQSANGSWYGSPYQTALAVRAMWEAMHEPDLAVATNDIAFTPAAITRIPEAITVQVAITNKGLTDVPEAMVRLYEGAVSEAGKIAEQAVSLPGTSSKTLTFDTDVTEGRSYRFYVEIDGTDRIAESCETNNMALSLLYPETTYDFEVRDAALSVTPATANVLTPVTITAEIRNNGAGDAFNVPVKYFANGEEVAASGIDALPAGETVTKEFIWEANRAGELSLSIAIDPDDAFSPELSETNNTGTAALTINQLVQPNLAVDYVNIAVTPNPPFEGGDAVITALVENNGFADIADVLVTVYNGVPDQGGSILGSAVIDSLASGESRAVELAWQDIPVSGEQIIYVAAVASDPVTEIKETDNSAFVSLDIVSLPDLEISSGSIVVAPSISKAGDIITITATVTNSGGQNALDVPVDMLENGAVIDSAVIDEIPGTSASAVTFTYDTTGKTGAHEVEIQVDPGNAIIEQDDTNNTATSGFGIQDADLWLTERYISPNGDGVKDDTRFFFNLPAPQTVQVAVADDGNNVIRRFTDERFEDTTGGDVTWDGLDANGMVADDGDYAIQVRDVNDTVIAFLPVTVDNNRSPLMDAIGTDYFYNKNITCMLPYIPPEDWQWFSDESGILFYIDNTYGDVPEYPRGLYTMTPDGGNINRLVPFNWREAGSDEDYGFVYYDHALSPNEQQVAIVLDKLLDGKYVETQIWTVGRYGEDLRNIVAYDYEREEDGAMVRKTIKSIRYAPDSGNIAYTLNVYHEITGYHDELYVVRPDGTDHQQIAETPTDGTITDYVWTPDGSAVVYVSHDSEGDPDRIIRTGLDGDTDTLFSAETGDVVHMKWLNPRKLVVNLHEEGYETYYIRSVDVVETGAAILVADDIRETNFYGGDYQMSFTPTIITLDNAAGFVFIDNSSDVWQVKQCNTMGNMTVLHESVFISDLRLSPDGNSLVFVDYAYKALTDAGQTGEDTCYYDASLVMLNLANGQKTVRRLDSRNSCAQAWSYHVHVMENSGWSEQGAPHLTGSPRTKYFDLDAVDTTSPFRVKIVQTGLDEAFINEIRLRVDGTRYLPSSAVNMKTGADVLPLLVAEDESVDAHNASIELVWNNLPAGIHYPELFITATETGYFYEDGSLKWFGNDTLVGVEEIPGDAEWANRIFAVNTAQMEENPVTEWTEDELRFKVSPLYNAVTYENPVDPASICAGTGYRDTWLMKSLLNLTASLSAAKRGQAVNLSGTAMDGNFDHYELEYAPVDDTTEWTPITPPFDIPVVDDTLATWIPPSEGTYYVQLTVTDKAGNTAVRRARVFWGERTSITGLYKSGATFTAQGEEFTGTGDIFSPSTDSTKEGVALHYKVMAPVHLEFTILDDKGTLVRAFEKDYATLPVNGTEDYIVWDGRDENGELVADGAYTITVFDYGFYTEVDRTPPEGMIALSDLEVEGLGGPAVRLIWQAADENLKGWVVACGEGENPDQWVEFKSGTWSAGCSTTDCYQKELKTCALEAGYFDEGIEFVVGKTFRITATDEAGNIRTITTDKMLEEQLVLYRFGEEDGDNSIYVPLERKQDQFYVADVVDESYLNTIFWLNPLETIRLPLTEATLQCCGYDGVWQDKTVVGTPDPGMFEMQWDPEGVDISTVQAFRIKAVDETQIKAVDETQAVHYSNELPFRPLLGLYVDLPRSSCPVYSYSQGIREDLNRLEFQISPEDADAWEAYHVYDSAAGDPIENGQGMFLPLPEDYDPETEYQLRIVGAGVSGEAYVSNQEDFMVCHDDATFGTGIFYPSTLDCGFVSNEAVITPFYQPPDTPYVSTNYYPPSDFKSITYILEDKSGQITVAESTDSTETEFVVSTADLAENVYELTGVLEYENQVKTSTVDFYVDRKSPTAAITAPVAGARLCPRPVQVSDDKGRYVIDIEGSITDNNPLPYREWNGQEWNTWNYRLYYGLGDNPVWHLAGSFWENNGRFKSGPFEFEIDDIKIGHLGTWDVSDLDPGTYSLRLLAVDHTGNVTCDTVSDVYIDSGIDLSVGGDAIFSPNSDGVQDEMTIYYTLDEYAAVDATVMREDTIMAVLMDGQTIAPGSHSMVWDGAGANDGEYTITLAATDGCGNSITRSIITTLDNTPPEAEIIYPGAGDPLGIIIEFLGSAADTNFSSYSLNAVDQANPGNSVELSTGVSPVNQDMLARWNTFERSGTWTLTLDTADKAGNTAETSVSIDLGDRQNLIMDLAAEPRLFSANGDGVLDETDIQYELNPDIGENYSVTATIAQSNGETVKIVQYSEVASGVHNFVWNGETDDGSPAVVSDGEYTVTLTVSPVSTPTVIHEETITVVVDTAAPALSFSSPMDNAYYQADVTVEGNVTDDHLASYQIECTDDTAVVFSIEGNQSCENHRFTTLEQLAEGSHTLAVSAEDGAGNTSQAVMSFAVDKTPPQSEFILPEADALFGGEATTVTVSAAIEEENLSAWTLRYGIGEDPDQWQELTTGDTLPAAPVFDWLVGPDTSIQDGAYTLSLLVEDKAGWQNETTRHIVVDSTPPTVAITTPPDSGYITEAFVLEGTARDENFSHYTVSLSNNPCAGDPAWSDIKQTEASVSEGVLASLAHLPSDGSYCLRLFAEDLAGNSAEQVIDITVDTQPPGTPVLSGDLDTQTGINLSWTPVDAADLAGYNLYRNGRQIASLIPETSYTETNLDEGTYTYTVKAEDRAGWESEPSNEVSFDADLTGPNVKLATPGDGATINDLVEIKGTAYSNDDFKEYRVYLGVGQSPAEWTHLRTSPLSVSYGVLASLADPLVSAGDYAVKLEAEDVNGNVSTCQSVFTLDNQPPDAPVLLSAQATEADVALTWEPNTDPVAGYLVYRNGGLVNADGPVVGDLTPYLIDAVTDTDAGLVDGDYTYHLVAMDQAENISAPSNAISVTVDTREPQALITSPENGHLFENPVKIKAVCEDQDVESVQFQYSIAGQGTWVDLGQPFASAPYVLDLDPTACGFTYGDYDIRAVAVDTHGQQDSAPQSITITYTDLTPPAAPEGFQAVVNGGEIDFTWDANTETDLDGYTVYYIEGYYHEPLSASPVPETSLHVSGGQDGTHSFCVKAVDAYGNESDPSATLSAIIYTPRLNQPDSPVSSPDISLSGSNAASGSTVTIFVNDAAEVDVTADATGGFSAELTLAEGSNAITARATDIAGNASKVSDPVTMIYSAAPSIPSGLEVSVNGYDCTLSWPPNPESDIAGYHVYRDGAELTTNPVSGTTYPDIDLADGIYYYAVSAEDNYGFESAPSNPVAANVGDVEAPQPPQGLTGIADESTVILSWDPNSEPDLAGYRVYRYSGDNWVQLPVGLIPETTTTANDANLKNGVYDFRVTALDDTGNESEPATVTVTVAATIPDAPEITTVQSHPQGGMLKICWEDMSDAGDVYLYHVYRSQTPGGPYTRVIEDPLDEACYLDEGVENNIDYYYSVTTVDEAGNESGYSNEVSARAEDVIPLPTPEILAPTVSGSPVTVSEWNVDVAGFAEAGSIVDLYNNGGYANSVTAKPTISRKDYPLGESNIYNVAVSPDDTRVAYCSFQDQTGETIVNVKDIAGGSVVSNVTLEGEMLSMEWSPDSNRLACVLFGAAYLPEVYVGDCETGEWSLLLYDEDEYRLFWASWSPVADSLIVAGMADATGICELGILDAETGGITPVLQTSTPGELLFGAALSQDGDYVSYLHQDTAGNTTLNVAAVTDGAPVFSMAPGFYGMDIPKWSPQGNRLAYASGGGGEILSVYDMATAEQFIITDEMVSGNIPLYDWTPDGERLVCFAYSDDTGMPALSRIPVGFSDYGEILAYPDDEPMYLKASQNNGNWLMENNTGDVLYWMNKGAFTFDAADLSPGNNTLQVRSEDDEDAGETGWSDPIIVTLTPDALPDLSLSTDDLFVYPPTPVAGETVIGSAAVKNLNPQLAENVIVEVYATDAMGAIEIIATETLDEIAAGSVESVDFFWDTTGRSGDYTITATADPENIVYEADETNNTVEKRIRVTGDYGLMMDMAVNPGRVARGESLHVYLDLANSGPALDGHLNVRVTDAYGDTVAELSDHALAMPYGVVDDRVYSFDTADIIAGDYAVQAVFEDQSGTRAETLSSFVIGRHIDLSAVVSSDRMRYGANAPVSIRVRTVNSGASALDTASCRLAITSPGGDEVYADTQPLSAMLSGASTNLNFTWDTGLHIPGTYDLSAVVMSGDTVMTEAAASFEITADARIAGTVDVAPGWIVPGNIVTADYSLTNTGNSAAADVPVDIMLIDPATGDVVDATRIEPDIAAGSSVHGSVSFDTDALVLNTYTVRLQTGETGDARTLAAGAFTVTDATPPVISVLSPAADSEYHTGFSLSVTAHDRLSMVKQVEYAMDGGPWHPMPPADPAAGRYANRFIPEANDEGAHVFAFRATDKFHNTSEPVAVPVRIVPRVDLAAGLNAPEYGMNAPLVIDAALTNIGWQKAVTLSAAVETRAGDPVHAFDTAAITLPADSSQAVNLTWNTGATPAGDYRAAIRVEKDGVVLDAVTVPFTIQPVIALAGAVNTPDSVPMGEVLDVGYNVRNNGNVAMADLDLTLTLIDPADQQAVLSREASVDINISDAVIGETSFDTAGLEAKTYQLVLSALINGTTGGTATVLAESTVAVIDTIPPEVTIVSPEPDQLFDGPVTLAVDAVDNASGIADVSYQFDSGEWQPMTAAGGDRYIASYDPAGQTDGTHTITFRAADNAGNVSMAPSVTIRIESHQAFKALTGTLAITPSPVLEETDAAFNYMVTNNTALPVETLTIQARIIDPDTGETVKTVERAASLAGNDIVAGNMSAAMDITPMAYIVKLSVSIDAPVLPRDLCETELEVLARPDIEIDKQTGGDVISLLVWLNDNCRLDCGHHGHDHQRNGQPPSRCITDKGGKNNGNCQDDQNCGHRCDGQWQWKDCVRKDLLEAVLDQAVLDYHIVTEKHQFEAELRNPFYTDILILGDHQNLGCKAAAELMEKVNAGTGIVSAMWFKHTLDLNAPPVVTSIFGVRMDGMPFMHDYTINIEDSPISAEGSLPPAGGALHVKAESGTRIAGWLKKEIKKDPWRIFSGKGRRHRKTFCTTRAPAIVLDTYGEARTVYFAFDLGLTLSGDGYETAASLLAGAVQYAHTSRDEGHPWQMVPVLTQIDTTSGDFDYTVTETFDPALKLYDPRGAAWITDNPWQFDVSLAPAETRRLPLFYLLPDTAGTYATETETGLIFDDTYVRLNTRTLDLKVDADTLTRYNDIIDSLKSLDVPWWKAFIPRGMIRRLEKARDRNIACRADIDKNIRDIIGVTHSLFLLPGRETTGLRKALDTLLATEQGRYYLYE